MPRFTFKAYDAAGRLEQGELDADSEKAALDSLARTGRFPLDVAPAAAGAAASASIWTREIGGRRGLSLASLATLTRELATLVRADLPIDEVLRIVALQPRIGARARRVVTIALERVMGGAALSEALAQDTGAVPEHVWRLVRAGEESGTLPQVLDEIAGYLEQTARMRGQIVTAMLYPLVLVIAAMATLIVISVVMVPAILPLFRDAGVEPPVLLTALVAVQRALVDWWPVTLGLVAAIIGGAIASARNEALCEVRDRFVLRLPLFGNLARDTNTARLARTLATLVRNGVPLLDALRVTAGVVRNRAFRAALREAEVEINTGGSLSATLERSGLLPELAQRFVRLGEQTGQLALMLTRTADIYDNDVQQRLQRLLGIAAPVVTIGIGLGIGGLILSVMGALLGLNEAVLR